MPGVLMIESMAQVGGFLMMKDLENLEDKLPFFAGIEGQVPAAGSPWVTS